MDALRQEVKVKILRKNECDELMPLMSNDKNLCRDTKDSCSCDIYPSFKTQAYP